MLRLLTSPGGTPSRSCSYVLFLVLFLCAQPLAVFSDEDSNASIPVGQSEEEVIPSEMAQFQNQSQKMIDQLMQTIQSPEMRKAEAKMNEYMFQQAQKGAYKNIDSSEKWEKNQKVIEYSEVYVRTWGRSGTDRGTQYLIQKPCKLCMMSPGIYRVTSFDIISLLEVLTSEKVFYTQFDICKENTQFLTYEPIDGIYSL